VSAETKKGTKPTPDTWRITDADDFWSKTALRAAGVLTIVGGLLSVFGFMNDPNRFGYAYLFAFFSVATLVLGGLFYVIALHFTGGHWGITSRRIAETAASGAAVLLVLSLPLFGGIMADKFDMYDEWMAHGPHAEHGEESGHEAPAHEAESGAEEHGSLGLFGGNVAHAQDTRTTKRLRYDPNAPLVHTPQMEAAHHRVLEHKSGWLATPYWYIRALVYLLLWVFMGMFYHRNSIKQDEASEQGRLDLALKMRKHSAWMAIAFGLSLTFASFDWVMSLEPSWYSTIFGVVIFAGSGVAIFALLTVVGISLHTRGLVGDAISVEHFHDHGKMLYGLMAFWAYVSFSQWMLIWYAGIPEEAIWYHKRWGFGWSFWALLLMVGHFALPFFFFMSRIIKRRLGLMRFTALWLLVMHICDVYFLVLPQAGAFSLRPMDIGALLFCGGAFFLYFAMTLKKHSLVPVGDPRLERSLTLTQSY